MKEKRWYPSFFMFVTTAAVSSVIIGLTIGTRAQVERNAAMALEIAVLRALPGLYAEDAGHAALHRIFNEKVSPPSEESGGAWTVRTEEGIAAYAVPVSGQGFWAPIKGVIGVAGDGRTVTGIAFYEQNETPGLGAEIETPVWRAQFRNKTLADGSKALRMKRPGEPAGESEVHAVTGATQTSVRVEKLINDSIAAWRQKAAGVE